MLAGGGGLAAAESGGRLHPTVALWPVELRAALRAALMAGERRVRAFTAQHGAAVAVFPLTDPDGFANANTPEELEALERR